VLEFGEALQAIDELDLKPDARDLLLGDAARALFKIE
jgi:hypothetical protein